MRASGDTPVASITTSPAPPTARLPRCTRCQSVAKPSSQEYWHMGETAIRLGRVNPPSGSGEKRCGIVKLRIGYGGVVTSARLRAIHRRDTNCEPEDQL